MNKHLHLLIFFTVLTVVSKAQFDPNQAFAPYSQGNLGVLSTDFYTKNFGMANVGNAISDKYSPNLKNGSLLTKNKFSILDVNYGFTRENLDYNGSKYNTGGGAIKSLNIVMPMSYKWTTAVSLTPYSTVNNSATSTTLIEGTTDSLFQYDESKGSLQRVTWSNGINVYKGLNLGAIASYTFGDITKEVNTVLVGDDNITKTNQSSKYSGVDWGVSASFEKGFTYYRVPEDYIPKRDTLFNILITKKEKEINKKEYKYNSKWSAYDTVYKERKLKLDTVYTTVVDTIYKMKKIVSKNNAKQVKKNSLVNDTIIIVEEKQDKKLKIGIGATYSTAQSWKRTTINATANTFFAVGDTNTVNVSTPSNIGVGISIGNDSRNNNWLLAFDYDMASAYNFQLGGISKSIPASSRMAVGFQLTPQIESEKFFKNTTYSIGAYQAKTPYAPTGEQLDEVGITFGLSFVDRARRSNESFRWREKSKTRLNYLSRYNVGVGVGMLGGSSATAIQQTFIKLNFGISLNSEWFVRRKIN